MEKLPSGSLKLRRNNQITSTQVEFVSFVQIFQPYTCFENSSFSQWRGVTQRLTLQKFTQRVVHQKLAPHDSTLA